MILRTWHGRTRIEDGDAYEQFMRERAAPDYSSVDGFVSLVFARRDEGPVAHFLLTTIWQNEEAVSAFAGPDAARAKYYPEDDQYLLEKEANSHNHHIFHQIP